jgi:hypothetical protein
MQGDGNLVLYDTASKPLWSSGTYGHPGAYAAMQDDCHLVVYGPAGAPLWVSNRLCGRHLSFGATGVSDGNVAHAPDKAVPFLNQIASNASLVWLTWKDGQSALTADQVSYVASASALGRPPIVVLTSVYQGGAHPRTDARRQQFCSTAKHLASLPNVYGIQIGNEPNLGGFFGDQTNAPQDWVRLARKCYPMIKAANPGVVVIGPSLAGSHDPGAFIRKMGTFYRSLSNPGYILDIWGHHPYPVNGGEKPDVNHPGTHIGMGDVADLRAAINDGFGGTAQGGTGKKPIWYTETGVTHATGKPTQLQNPDPIAWYERAYRLAACQTGVRGFFSFQLADDPPVDGAWQSGMLYSNWTPKGDLARIANAANAGRAMAVNCAQFSGSVK